MVELVKAKRKPPVLTPSSIPCLRNVATINVTRGCALGCTYCYIQGYSGYPGAGRIVLYENIPELVQRELTRRRHRLNRVYFSPSSDAFQNVPEVQAVTMDTLSVLLEAGVEVALLTKGFVTEHFLALFARAPHRIFVQIGITSLDRRVWRTLEPHAASPGRRIEALTSLRRLGVATTARLDPLIPDVTDTDEALAPLLERLSHAGVAKAAVSYIFLRPPFGAKLAEQIRSLGGVPDASARWAYQQLADGCGGGRMIEWRERARRFERMIRLAKRFGIELEPCRCKNPQWNGPGCQIAGPAVSPQIDSSTQRDSCSAPEGWLFAP